MSLEEFFFQRSKLNSMKDCIEQVKLLREEVIKYSKEVDTNNSLLSAITRLDSIYNTKFDYLENELKSVKKDIEWIKVILSRSGDV